MTAQNDQSRPDILKHVGGGKITINSIGAWPLHSAIERLRLEYGWVVDYEEGIPSAGNIIVRPDGKRAHRMRAVSVSLNEPLDKGVSEAHKGLQSLLQQLNHADFPNYQVIEETGDRLGVVPTADNQGLVLSTPVILDSKTRSISETVDEILNLVQAQSGQRIVQGGLIDRVLDTTQVTVGSTAPTPARELLAKALEGAAYKRVWVLTYDPELQEFHFGIQPALQMIKDETGSKLKLIKR
jgi:hypothetical protein